MLTDKRTRRQATATVPYDPVTPQGCCLAFFHNTLFSLQQLLKLVNPRFAPSVYIRQKSSIYSSNSRKAQQERARRERRKKWRAHGQCDVAFVDALLQWVWTQWVWNKMSSTRDHYTTSIRRNPAFTRKIPRRKSCWVLVCFVQGDLSPTGERDDKSIMGTIGKIIWNAGERVRRDFPQLWKVWFCFPVLL